MSTMPLLKSSSFGIFSVLMLLNGLHQLIQLLDLLVAHLRQFPLVNLLTHPGFALNLLRIHLPFRKEANQVSRIIHVPMSSKLSLDILISEKPHFRGEEFPVGAQKPSVQRNRRQEGHWLGPQAVLHGRGRCQLCEGLAHVSGDG